MAIATATACIVQIAIGFFIAGITGAVLVRLLPKWEFRQTAYEDAPATHQKKTGTPTMGGICFAVAMAALVLQWNTPFAPAMVFLTIACAALGFLDDFMKIRRGKNLGLQARTKFLASALIAIVFLRLIDQSYDFYPRDVLFHAATYALVVPHWLWLLLGILAITGTIHAVNLTDGLDGLAAGTIIPPLAIFAAIAATGGWVLPVAAIAPCLGIGACLGFLLYNRHPAKMIMGDTGSLALGALLSGTAILTGEMLLLVLVGGVFVAETLSVMLQVGYFKLSKGKRIFRMSPLHHHFELGGLPETKVTKRFWIASTLLSLIGYAVVR